ncbi:hypothetical protein D3C81_1912030 [compost metagenome]
MVVQKEQIARTERVQHRQIDLFPGVPELFDQRLGIQLAVKRQKQGDGMGHNHRGVRHHTGCSELGEMRLLFGRKRSTMFTD